jgi:hypothetical protein
VTTSNLSGIILPRVSQMSFKSMHSSDAAYVKITDIHPSSVRKIGNQERFIVENLMIRVKKGPVVDC